MIRKLPEKCPLPPRHEAGVSQKRTFSINVVTPLFGGGVEPGVNDPVTLIRGASVRGHLRFWWRATRGAAFDNWRKLRAEENRIWGSAEVPSQVSVRIYNVNKGQANKWAAFEKEKDGRFKSTPTPIGNLPKYALFPFQGKLDKNRVSVSEEPSEVTWNTSFDLTCDWSSNSLSSEVEAAVWAWVNFGGLGARTRRGCGILFCQELAPPSIEDLDKWYLSCLEKYAVKRQGGVREWPTLPQKIGIKGPLMPPEKAWSTAIEVLQKFRQLQGVGRNGEKGRPGRSRWPEADSIRRITGYGSAGHKTSITTSFNAFPRAEFGLPIIFHFKDEDRGDPPDCELIPEMGKKRLASPLILKPLSLSADKAVAMALRLNTPPLDSVYLKCDKLPAKSCSFTETAIRNPNFTAYHNSPLKDRCANGSALDAFMEYIRKEGFK